MNRERYAEPTDRRVDLQMTFALMALMAVTSAIFTFVVGGPIGWAAGLGALWGLAFAFIMIRRMEP